MGSTEKDGAMGKVVNDSTSSGAQHELQVGTRVDVRSRFVGSWTNGFEIAQVTENGYRLKRLSDGSTLPTVFGPDEVREERRSRQGLWWYR
ncbi:MAG: hypothetical protein ACYDEY_04975 [Acidimicrobiales bacterium]